MMLNLICLLWYQDELMRPMYIAVPYLGDHFFGAVRKVHGDTRVEDPGEYLRRLWAEGHQGRRLIRVFEAYGWYLQVHVSTLMICPIYFMTINYHH